MPRRDMTGQTFGFLTAVSIDHINRHVFWLFRCECGSEKVLNGALVRRGSIKSCGCRRKELIGAATRRHGLSNTPTHKSWLSMLQRAQNPRACGHDRYYDAGIRVVDRWLVFENFLADMGPRPTGMTLDRIDNEKGYEPGNCRWATQTMQSHNRRITRWIDHAGQRRPLAEWARLAGLCETTLRDRLAAGWGVDRALSTPSRRRA